MARYHDYEMNFTYLIISSICFIYWFYNYLLNICEYRWIFFVLTGIPVVISTVCIAIYMTSYFYANSVINLQFSGMNSQ